MSNRKPNLWKPNDTVERNYLLCERPLCVNMVTNKGDICSDHKHEELLSRSPRNLVSF